jgi:hypothetical protein
VTIVIRRPVGVFVGLAAAAALLTACGSGPSQVGTALIVGNTSVSVNQIQQELDDALNSQPAVKKAQEQGQLATTSRGFVTTHVLHELVSDAAAREQLSITDAQLDQAISQYGGLSAIAGELGAPPSQARSAFRDALLEAQLTRKYADTLEVKFGYLVATSRSDALAKANQLAADPNSLSAMVNAANAQAQASGQQTAGGETEATFVLSTYLQNVAQTEAQSGQPPTENDGPVFGTPVNTVIAFQPDAQQSPAWIVALIKSRDQSGTAPAGGSTADTVSLSTLQRIGVSMLQPEATKLGVRVSPRYGVWNQVGMQVVSSDDQTAGVEIPVRTTKP